MNLFCFDVLKRVTQNITTTQKFSFRAGFDDSHWWKPHDCSQSPPQPAVHLNSVVESRAKLTADITVGVLDVTIQREGPVLT
jgi:hypothetical protein